LLDEWQKIVRGKVYQAYGFTYLLITAALYCDDPERKKKQTEKN